MSLRVRSAQWFELLVPRRNIAHALEVLASSGAVELDEAGSRSSSREEDFSVLAQDLVNYQRMRHAYKEHWPAPRLRPFQEDALLETMLARAMTNLGRWEVEAKPIIRNLEVLEADRHETTRLFEFLVTVRDDRALCFAPPKDGDETLQAMLFVMAANSEMPNVTEQILVRRTATAYHTYFLALGPTSMIHSLVDTLGGTHVRPVALPAWLRGHVPEALRQTERRLSELEREIHEEQSRVARLAENHDVAYSLGDIDRFRWVVDHIHQVPMTRYMARVTGWTSDPTGLAILGPLRAAGIPEVLGLPNSPESRTPPTLTDNPAWAQQYELFVRLMGTPGRDETDPSGLLAFVIPVLFGYMFGDVGQGVVLIAAGLVLRQRWPAAAILIPAGSMAAIFGFVFGSVFAREDLLQPLWVHPLADPVSVLSVSLYAGAFLISLGLVLSGLMARWSGHFGRWLRVDAGFLLIYLGALAVPIATYAIAVSVTGVLWYLVGSAFENRHDGLMGLVGSFGNLLERLLGLAVNTISFVRVGAFVLAHAGLSLAIVNLASATGSEIAGLVVLVFGNLVILALEGLIVGIQTTRLVLFEFFVRFFQAEGREFRPLKPPLGTNFGEQTHEYAD